MYQVFDSELFGPPPQVDNDFTLQRSRDPGDGIEDVLNWLGLPSGGQMCGMGEDPGGGSDRRGGGGAGGEKGGVFGQLMEIEGDDVDYIDYSCFSSGLMSPDLDAEFFGKPSVECLGTRQGIASSYPWEFTAMPASLSGLPERPPSPYFRLDASFRFADNSFPVKQYDRTYAQCEFDSEAAAKVKEIARYLASFEVQSASSNSTVASSNLALPFTATNPVSRTNANPCQVKTPIRSKTNDVGIFHLGYDDSGCGLESTMVNPNEVFPDRNDRSDHQYASRSTLESPHSRASSGRHTQRTSSGNFMAGGSVLEALLRSNEPIDPNKGSGAAFALEVPEAQQEHSSGGPGPDSKTSERMLKKLLTARIRDDDLARKSSLTCDIKRGVRVNEERYLTLSPGNRELRPRGGYPLEFVDIEPQLELGKHMELTRELDEVMREENDSLLSVSSGNRATELLRFI